MRKFNWYELGEEFKAVTKEDKEAIQECIDNEVEMTIDENNRIYNEAGTYIADVEER